MRNLLLAFLILTTMGVEYSSAATKELTRAIFSTIPWEEEVPDFDMRLRFAQAIKAYWENFDSRVPRLSPQEQEWIKEQLSSPGDRLNRALNTDEYAIWSLNKHTDLCLDTISNVLEAMANEQTRQVEMFYWLKMVNCYDGSSDLTIYLDRAGIPYNDQADQHIQTPLSNLTQQIIVNKMATTAMAETMGWTFDN